MIRKGIIVTRDGMRLLGGPGSGNFGHGGIPGQRGGSVAGTGGGATVDSAGPGPGNILSNPDYHNETVDFSDDERVGLNRYKGSGYAGVNKLLFGKDPNDARAEETLKYLDSALEKTTITGGKYYSGLGESGSREFAKMGVGDEFQYKGFLSTSTDPGASDTFKASIIDGGKNIQNEMVVYAKHGTHAYSYGSEDDEGEVLFDRDLNMRIIDIKEEPRSGSPLGIGDLRTPDYTSRKYHVEIL